MVYSYRCGILSNLENVDNYWILEIPCCCSNPIWYYEVQRSDCKADHKYSNKLEEYSIVVVDLGIYFTVVFVRIQSKYHWSLSS